MLSSEDVSNNGGGTGPALASDGKCNGDGSARRILIVDDDATTARALGTILTAAGFQARACHNGADALACAAEQPFDAAMVDIHLGDLNGLILAQQLRQRLGPRAPIIMISGDTSMATLNSLPHVGANYFFSKPMHPRMLVERLTQCLADS